MVEGAAPTAQDMDELRLAADAGAPRAARDLVVRACGRWGVPDLAGVAELVVSELVTNVVQHAGTGMTVRVARTADGVLVAVEDGSPDAPVVVPAVRRGPGGLGLAIVERAAVEWGVDAGAAGKTVWAVVGTAGAIGGDGGGMSGGDAVRADEVATGGFGIEGQTVFLELPWDKDLVVIARSAAAHAGVRAGFSRQEVEDLRLAVDEACGLVLGLSDGGGAGGEPVLGCRFGIADGKVCFTVTAAVGAAEAPAAGAFGWHLLGALVDSIGWVSEAGVSGVRAEKRGGPR